MPTSSRTVQLAGDDLREHRHVCVLVDGPEDAYELLMPFIVDGFKRGDRAVHLVDPETQGEHIARLETSGIDVPAATARGQLRVATWADSYMRGGQFDGSRQLKYLLEALDEGPDLGYPATRLIGGTEWAVDAQTQADLMHYESRIDERIRGRSDVVVCTYDLNRHSARMIADALGAHQVAVVGGILRTSRPAPAVSARNRVLTAASRLFHESGIQATGVDSLIDVAGVAKATFYRHFPSKDDLVVAWLRDPRTRWIDHVHTQIDASDSTAAERIPLFFDALATWLETEDYRGCPYLNTASELTDPAHPAHAIIRDYLQDVEDYVDSLLAAAGYRDSRALAEQLQTLVAGAISLAVARRSSASVVTAREAAQRLLDGAKRV